MDISEIVQNLPAINPASAEMISLFGPRFTGTPRGHIETDISAAASLAGLMILRSRFPQLPDVKPGTLFLQPLDDEMNLIMKFVMGMCQSLELDPSTGWDTKIPTEKMPLYRIPELTKKSEKDFLAICTRYPLKKDYYPYVAALGSLRLVSAGTEMKIIDQNIGKALVWFHIYGGARTIPYPDDA